MLSDVVFLFLHNSYKTYFAISGNQSKKGICENVNGGCKHNGQPELKECCDRVRNGALISGTPEGISRSCYIYRPGWKEAGEVLDHLKRIFRFVSLFVSQVFLTWIP